MNYYECLKSYYHNNIERGYPLTFYHWLDSVKGININCKHQDFVQQILDGKKTIETRNTHSLRCYVGRRIGLVKTGCGKATLCGFATITKEIHYGNEEEFRSDEDKHLVSKGSLYDIVDEKYGYVLTDVVEVEPYEIKTRGIVAREII